MALENEKRAQENEKRAQENKLLLKEMAVANENELLKTKKRWQIFVIL